MNGAMYEAAAFVMRYWFVFAALIILLAVISASASEYRQKKNMKAEIGRYVGYLELLSGPEELLGNRYGIQNENTVGRAQKCDICIPDYSVAKTHALLYTRDGELVLSPLGRVITMVNGKRITEPATVRTGNVITLGEIDARVFIKRTRLQHDY